MRELAFERDHVEGCVVSPHGYGVVALDMAGRCRELAHSTPLAARVACEPSCAAVVDGRGRELCAVGKVVAGFGPNERVNVQIDSEEQRVIDEYLKSKCVPHVERVTGVADYKIRRILKRNNVPLVSVRRPLD